MAPTAARTGPETRDRLRYWPRCREEGIAPLDGPREGGECPRRGECGPPAQIAEGQVRRAGRAERKVALAGSGALSPARPATGVKLGTDDPSDTASGPGDDDPVTLSPLFHMVALEARGLSRLHTVVVGGEQMNLTATKRHAGSRLSSEAPPRTAEVPTDLRLPLAPPESRHAHAGTAVMIGRPTTRCAENTQPPDG